jgi:hypothetical protein
MILGRIHTIYAQYTSWLHVSVLRRGHTVRGGFEKSKGTDTRGSPVIMALFADTITSISIFYIIFALNTKRTATG